MPFNSIHFLFIFLPAVLLVYFGIRNEIWRNLVLVVFSLLFYAWVDLAHLPLLVGLVLLHYIVGRWLGNQIDRGATKNSIIRIVAAVVLVDLLMLVGYKYGGFAFSWRLFGVGDSPAEQPFGFSYFLLSALSYFFDIYYRSDRAERSLLRFTAYLVMFPRLTQGPIASFKEIRPGLLGAKVRYADQVEGARRFILGLAKKVLIADLLAVPAERIFGADMAALGATVAWLGLIAYSLQIYFDFSGYTDMAIGLGKILGFNLPENFNYPYTAVSITDFWRRWHMTLTGWFRNYVFIPLEFARKRVKILRQQTDILVVFLLTGLWHGASWNFVAWGLYFGLILALEVSGWGKVLKRLPPLLQHAYTLGLVVLGWSLFRFESFDGFLQYWQVLTMGNGFFGMTSLRELNGVGYLPVMAAALVFSTPVVERGMKQMTQRLSWFQVAIDACILGLFVVSVAVAVSSGFRGFLYAQF
ncbi:MAG: MBOAT family protein [Anaerolineae bacterium]|nr:MBOAT family protein [Anaerolineae bacterium]